jgi:hypothetical protein
VRSRRLKAFVSSPIPYAAWALLVVSALVATYFVDPYVFAFATFVLGGAMVGVALVGIPTSLVARAASRRRRAVIFGSIAAAAAVVICALVLLRSFNWA